ncbi:MAG: hypothetical protein ACFFD4_11810 [Candidatus Odinarchaeota archaeon]
MQAPIIQGSITIKNLSFEGKEIIKALLEQGINVDVDGDFLRVGSKLIKSSPESVMTFSSRDNPGNLPDSGFCPFYRNFEHFSAKIDRLYEIIGASGSLNRNDARGKNESRLGGLYSDTKPVFNRDSGISDFRGSMKNSLWNIPQQDLRKTRDFLYADRSVQKDPRKLFSTSFPDSFEQLGGRTCNHCGSPLSKNGFFCNLCGNKIESVE